LALSVLVMPRRPVEPVTVDVARLAPLLRAHLAVAIADHIRQLRRDGRTVPDGLPELARALLERDAERDAAARRRMRSAERSRRYRRRRNAAGGQESRGRLAG
jgi:hypothetical protein